MINFGNFIELKHKYRLMFCSKSPKKTIKKALKLANSNNVKNIWYQRSNRLQQEKIDLTQFMADITKSIECSGSGQQVKKRVIPSNIH
jgi:predicted glycosyltransferase